MNSEPTEMAGVAEAETQAAYAWALDYDGYNELPTVPIRRLTPRRITALALASSLAVIATAGAIALGVIPAHESESVVAAPAAVLDGTYRLDYNWSQSTVMGSPNSPEETKSTPETHWAVFRSTCSTPAGCTATSTGLDDKTHTIADTPPVMRQWHFVNGRWVTASDRERTTMDTCKFDENEGKRVAGDETISHTKWLEPQPDGTLHGVLSMTTVSGECGREGGVHQIPFIATRIGDVPPGVVVADPSTVPPPQPIPPAMPGPVLDGAYRLDYDSLNTTYSDGARNPSTTNFSRWYAYRSKCTAAGCVATEADLDEANHQEAIGLAGVHYFTNGHWINNGPPVRIPCDPNRRGGATTAEETVVLGTDLVPQPDGTLRGVSTITFKSNECGEKGSVMTTPVVATRTGSVPPNVVLADPALFA